MSFADGHGAYIENLLAYYRRDANTGGCAKYQPQLTSLPMHYLVPPLAVTSWGEAWREFSLQKLRTSPFPGLDVIIFSRRNPNSLKKRSERLSNFYQIWTKLGPDLRWRAHILRWGRDNKPIQPFRLLLCQKSNGKLENIAFDWLFAGSRFR